MRFQNLFRVAPLVTAAAAANLYAAGYSGAISSLKLTQASNSANYTLALTASNLGSAPQPSWLEKHPSKNVIYGLNENWAGVNGSIAAYTPAADGSLTRFDLKDTLGGPVSSVVYAGGRAIAVANYGSSSIQTFAIAADGSLSLLQSFQYTLSQPGPVPDRQERPHPHQVVLDPSGAYILAADLGADVVRIYSVDSTTLQVKEENSLAVAPGSGPRHGAFLTTSSGAVYFFLVTELSNKVISYKVTYGRAPVKSLGFSQRFISDYFGSSPAPAGSKAAEVLVSPDKRFLVTSSRNNAPPTGSDTLQTWLIDHATGALTFVQNTTSGGISPRHFSFNKNGSLVAVALQDSGRVVIFKRDVKTGLIGPEVAKVDGLDGANTVIWQ